MNSCDARVDDLCKRFNDFYSEVKNMHRRLRLLEALVEQQGREIDAMKFENIVDTDGEDPEGDALLKRLDNIKQQVDSPSKPSTLQVSSGTYLFDANELMSLFASKPSLGSQSSHGLPDSLPDSIPSASNHSLSNFQGTYQD